MATLDLDAIAAAGLVLVDDGGPDALTMRAVADTLGVSPMALYHYVENKSALVALIVDKASNEQPLPAASGQDWSDEIFESANWIRDSMWAHPNLLRLRAQHNVYAPVMLTFGERWINLWRQSGLEFDAANRASAASATAIIGYVNEEIALRGFTPPDPALLSWLPNMQHLAASPPDPAAGFELFVRSLIAGMHDVLSQALVAQRSS